MPRQTCPSFFLRVEVRTTYWTLHRIDNGRPYRCRYGRMVSPGRSPANGRSPATTGDTTRVEVPSERAAFLRFPPCSSSVAITVSRVSIGMLTGVAVGPDEADESPTAAPATEKLSWSSRAYLPIHRTNTRQCAI